MAAYTKLKQKFDEYLAKKGAAVMSKVALNWYYEYTNRIIKKASFNKTLGAGVKTSSPTPGKFYLYQYDPKTKDKMPYYDTVPLVLITDLTDKGWYGINFHYMPPAARLAIMEGFYATISDPNTPERVKLKSNWTRAVSVAKAASSHKFLQHSIKQYLGNHVTSPLIELDPEYWAMCLFLPLSRFKKQKESHVW